MFSVDAAVQSFSRVTVEGGSSQACLLLPDPHAVHVAHSTQHSVSTDVGQFPQVRSLPPLCSSNVVVVIIFFFL